MIRQREIIKRDQLSIDRQLFEQRSNLRSVKQNLPDQYKEGDEEILITQKVKKSHLSSDLTFVNIFPSRRRNL